jgi:hypothetical protein
VATKKLGAALPTRQRPTSNLEWEKMKKQTYDLEKILKSRIGILNSTAKGTKGGA